MRKRVIAWTAAVSLALCQIAVSQAPPVPLTLKDAETLALRNHPRVLEAQSNASEANQQVRETKSAYYPTLDADLTGSQGNRQARIGAGYLTASSLWNRFGQGLTLSQLITDSGRTPNLVASSGLHAQATQENYQATRYDVLLRVNQAYLDALRAEAVVRVAEETVKTRQVLSNQVTELANNKLRSQLDVSFADVNLSQAKLLLIRAQDAVKQAFAELTRAIGSGQTATYTLTDQGLPPSPPISPEPLIADAMNNRPELLSLQLERQSAQKFEQAETDLKYPTVDLAAVGGFIPFINQQNAPRLIPKEYEGVAVNVNIPIFNGHLFSARRQAAEYRELASEQRLRNVEQQVARDVRVAWASASTAYQRIDVTAQLLKQANLGLNLAQGRYNLGLSSIVELSQAQLNLTQAQIENLSAKYDYESQYAALQYAIGLLR
ncbi:MAG TPA: TolC family protein [Candidatus Binatia bacterium]|nr:TolC family protein [Candidatus Binatia bacterium]